MGASRLAARPGVTTRAPQPAQDKADPVTAPWRGQLSGRHTGLETQRGKAYVGTKIIRAYRNDRGDGASPGYTVIYPDGYVSWSPRDTFEACYREVSTAEKALVDG